MFSTAGAGQPMGLTTTSWCDVKHYSPCLCSMFNSMFSIVLVTKIPWGCVLSWWNFPVWKSSKRRVFYNHWNIRQNTKYQRGIDGFSQYACLVAIKRSSSHPWYFHRCNPGQKDPLFRKEALVAGIFPSRVLHSGAASTIFVWKTSNSLSWGHPGKIHLIFNSYWRWQVEWIKIASWESLLLWQRNCSSKAN